MSSETASKIYLEITFPTLADICRPILSFFLFKFMGHLLRKAFSISSFSPGLDFEVFSQLRAWLDGFKRNDGDGPAMREINHPIRESQKGGVGQVSQIGFYQF